MKIALCQVNTTVGAFRENGDKIVEFARRARKRGADLAIFPELVIPGYPPRDLLERPDFVEANLRELERIARSVVDISLIVGFADRNISSEGKPLFNAAAVIDKGQVKERVYKSLIPTYDVFSEGRYFEPAPKVFPRKVGSASLAITLCEDCWNDKDSRPRQLYKNDPLERLARENPDVLINISGSPFSRGKMKQRENVFCAIARKYGLPVAYVNLVGGNDSLIFDGASFAIRPDGSVAARAAAFEEDLVVFDFETGKGEIRPKVDDEAETILQALVLGTRDYLSKCGFRRAVVGLSGGIDSSVTAAVGVRAIGAPNVLGISMPSPFSSEGSRRDARQFAKNLEIEFRTIAISDVYAAYREMLSEVFQGLPEDTTEENIQARIRGNILMAISNKLNSIVLSTGNKSELAVGYCTLYGDMSGGLGIIGDVPKTLVYRLAERINSEREIIPREVIEKPPSAELRPDQRDEDTLPPYDVLDPILEAYIENNRSAKEIVAMGFKQETVEEVLRMVDRNEYKREQAAPALRVTSKAFGPGRNYPIAQRWR